MKILFVICLILLAISTLFAQEKPTTSPTVASILDQQLSFAENDFLAAAEVMPEEKYSFAPSSGEFKDVRSFALQVRHVAFANHVFFGTILGEKPPAPGPTASSRNGPDSIKTKAQILEYLRESFAMGHRAIATITPDNLITVIENAPVSRFNTRLALASHACSHAYDHYGQMVEYLRMNRIVPPATSAQPTNSTSKR
ncbi:MAG: hypothetical protein DMG71_02140 [Acidobacteria bacterium]|nr:MAG: hypothetical protein DMG71_02140 [Acidobacteriota bacterium]